VLCYVLFYYFLIRLIVLIFCVVVDALLNVPVNFACLVVHVQWSEDFNRLPDVIVSFHVCISCYASLPLRTLVNLPFQLAEYIQRRSLCVLCGLR